MDESIDAADGVIPSLFSGCILSTVEARRCGAQIKRFEVRGERLPNSYRVKSNQAFDDAGTIIILNYVGLQLIRLKPVDSSPRCKRRQCFCLPVE